jgi:hypothetical protein
MGRANGSVQRALDHKIRETHRLRMSGTSSVGFASLYPPYKSLMLDPVQAPSLRHAFELVNAAVLEGDF